MPTSTNDLALRYLLELSSDIRGALLLNREGGVLASAGNLPAADIAAVGERIAAATRALSPNGGPPGVGHAQAAVEVDVWSTGGAMFLLAEAAHVMACIANRTVHPGLIFYDMHAVLRDLERAAAAERQREGGGPA